MYRTSPSNSGSESRPLKLLIVVVNYFSADLVSGLVLQLNKQLLNIDGTPVKINSWSIHTSIICADNSASNEEQGALREIQLDSKIGIKLELNSNNLGFGKAINQSVEGQDFDFLCCINPDVALSPNTISALLKHAINSPEQAVWGCLTVNDQNEPDYRHAWQEPSLKKTFAWVTGASSFLTKPCWQDSYRHMKDVDYKAYSVDSISGCCFLISSQAWNQIEGFDTDFFLYSEEIDLCRRARESHFQPTVVVDAKIKHSAHVKNESAQRIKSVYSAKMLYASKHHGLAYNALYRALMLLGSSLRACKYIVTADYNIAKAWIWLAGQSLIPSQTRLSKNNQ